MSICRKVGGECAMDVQRQPQIHHSKSLTLNWETTADYTEFHIEKCIKQNIHFWKKQKKIQNNQKEIISIFRTNNNNENDA